MKEINNDNQKSANIIAFIWGLAEATLFFIVPDVYISYRALKGLKFALLAALFSLLGALVGGTIVYFAPLIFGTLPVTILSHIPGITDELPTTVLDNYNERGVFALFEGPKQGIPYKLYAVFAHDQNIGFLSFIVVSVFARMIRFVAVGIIVGALSSMLKKWLSYTIRFIILILFWIIFYAVYFYALYS